MFGYFKKENICPDHFPDFNLGSFIIIKSMFIMKNLTNFRKTVETGVNPQLRGNLIETGGLFNSAKIMVSVQGCN